MNCSPVILLLKVADRDEASSAAQGKLVLQWWPLHTSGCTVDAHQDQGGLPHTILQSPHVGVAVRGTCHNAVRLWGPVNACGHNYEALFKCQKTDAWCNDNAFYIFHLCFQIIYFTWQMSKTHQFHEFRHHQNINVHTKLWTLLPPCDHTIKFELKSIITRWFEVGQYFIRITQSLRCFYSITKSKKQNVKLIKLHSELGAFLALKGQGPGEVTPLFICLVFPFKRSFTFFSRMLPNKSHPISPSVTVGWYKLQYLWFVHCAQSAHGSWPSLSLSSDKCSPHCC